jgi:hypothetical protein
MCSESIPLRILHFDIVKRFIASAWLMAALAPLPAVAQPARAPLGESAADYRFQIGPLGLAPTLVIDNFGIDTNAMLTPTQPIRDFTVRTTPGAMYLLPIRRLRIYGNSTVSFQYYQKTASQRSIDSLNHAAISFAANTVVPTVFGVYGRLQSRPNAEIEAMVDQLTQGLGIGADIRFSPRFVVHADGERNRLDFEKRVFRGALLDRQLNRTTEVVRVGARVDLTPISALTITGNNTRERFQYSPTRDAESFGVAVGLATKPSALIAGSASVGYRRFNALSDTVPDDRGATVDLKMSYTLLDRTRFGVTGRRDLEFSSEVESPYYVITGGGVSITQMLGHGWDLQVGATGERLAYRSFIDPQTAVYSGRTDHVDSAFGGFGFKVGDTGRFGFEVAHVTRRSPILRFEYEGYRAGVKITYGT